MPTGYTTRKVPEIDFRNNAQWSALKGSDIENGKALVYDNESWKTVQVGTGLYYEDYFNELVNTVGIMNFLLDYNRETGTTRSVRIQYTPSPSGISNEHNLYLTNGPYSQASAFTNNQITYSSNDSNTTSICVPRVENSCMLTLTCANCLPFFQFNGVSLPYLRNKTSASTLSQISITSTGTSSWSINDWNEYYGYCHQYWFGRFAGECAEYQKYIRFNFTFEMNANSSFDTMANTFTTGLPQECNMNSDGYWQLVLRITRR